VNTALLSTNGSPNFVLFRISPSVPRSPLSPLYSGFENPRCSNWRGSALSSQSKFRYVCGSASWAIPWIGGPLLSECALSWACSRFRSASPSKTSMPSSQRALSPIPKSMSHRRPEPSYRRSGRFPGRWSGRDAGRCRPGVVRPRHGVSMTCAGGCRARLSRESSWCGRPAEPPNPKILLAMVGQSPTPS
jgi:hypothetical protein